jgi:hypothetical protein
MAPSRRVPLGTEEALKAGQVLRYARLLKPARGAEHDPGRDGAARLGRHVLEQDGVLLRVVVPRRAHDLRAQARVRAQTVPRPQRVPVRVDLALGRVVRFPARVQRAREGVPVSRDVTRAALVTRPPNDLSSALYLVVVHRHGLIRLRTGYVLSFCFEVVMAVTRGEKA